MSQTNTNDHTGDGQGDPEATPPPPMPSEAPPETLQGEPAGYMELYHQGVDPIDPLVYGPLDNGLLYPNDEPIVIDPAFDQALESFQIEREAMRAEVEAFLAPWQDEAALFLEQNDPPIPPED